MTEHVLLADKIEQVITREPDIALVYLFGSRATGAVGPLSDYDLAVWLDRGSTTLAWLAKLQHEFACALGTDRIDLVVLNEAPIELAYRVIAQGKLLYQRDIATRVEYEADVLSRYGDYLPVLRQQRESILKGEGDEVRARRYREAFGRTERTLAEIRAAQDKESAGI